MSSNVEQKIDYDVLYKGTSKKLTVRGKGELGYEIGQDEEGTLYIRISSNERGGTCSFEWISLNSIKELLEGEGKNTFSSKKFQKLYTGRSMNNSGYLAAILKSEQVIKNTVEKGTALAYVSLSSIEEKIEKLSKRISQEPPQQTKGMKPKKTT